VQIASDAGPNARHENSRFTRDGEYAQSCLEAAIRENRDWAYLGEWHSHPIDVGPSPTDTLSMAWVAEQDAYAQPKPLLIVACKTSANKWLLRAYARWSKRGLRKIPIIDEDRRGV